MLRAPSSDQRIKGATQVAGKAPASQQGTLPSCRTTCVHKRVAAPGADSPGTSLWRAAQRPLACRLHGTFSSVMVRNPGSQSDSCGVVIKPVEASTIKNRKGGKYGLGPSHVPWPTPGPALLKSTAQFAPSPAELLPGVRRGARPRLQPLPQSWVLEFHPLPFVELK